jgi:hypothetical protein
MEELDLAVHVQVRPVPWPAAPGSTNPSDGKGRPGDATDRTESGVRLADRQFLKPLTALL